MRKMVVFGMFVAGCMGIGLAQPVFAERYTSPNYTIDASVGNSFGGASGSANYKLVSSGGESIIGNGAGGSYKLGQGYVEQLERSLELTVQPSGLVGYYDFDEPIETGRAVYNRAKSTMPDMNTVGSPTSVNGQIGKAAQLDTPSEYFEADQQTPYEQVDTGEVLTMTYWFRTGANVLQSALYDDWNCTGWSTGMRPDGGVSLSLALTTSGCGTGQYSYISTAPYNDDEWHHVVAEIDRVSNTLVLYIDGDEKVSGPIDSPTLSSANTRGVRFGTNWNATDGFDGELDNVKFYERALTAYEVEAEYDAGVAGIETGLAFPEAIVPGSSRQLETDAIVQTDAPGYTLSVSQNNNLTSGGSTIPAIAGGSIATPAAWNEGTTKGLGFTVASSTATAPAAKWNAGASYAALPGAPTSIYSRSGYTGGIKDVTTLGYRLDVATSQASGKYTNTVTYTGTMTP